jgi:hypothetical protein
MVEAALFTVCDTGEEVLLPTKLESPLYEAVMLWVATLRDDVAQVAVSVVVLTGRAAQPLMSLPPSLNSTVPPGLPDPGLLTAMLTVMVTGWPKTEGAGVVVRVTDVFAWLMVRVPGW